MGNNETTPSEPDSLLGEFTKARESRISETTSNTDNNNHSLAFLFTTVGSRIALRSKRVLRLDRTSHK